jgi:hypothetical protein
MLFDKHNGSRADVVKFRSRLNHGHPNIHPSKTDPPQWDDDAGVNMVRVMLLAMSPSILVSNSHLTFHHHRSG